MCLTSRELEILDLIADGLTYDAIALELYISVITVKRHMRSIRDKLNSTTNANAVFVATQQHIIPLQLDEVVEVE